jgi:hypothetical protein
LENLTKVTIKRILGPTPQGAAILIGNEKKTFAVFIGPYEAMAMIREVKNEKLPRPMTHDLIQHIFLGFELSIKKVIVSNLSSQTYFATLVLEQRGGNNTEETSHERKEVRIDARPSDCFVLALKNKSDIFVTDEVFEKVEDVSEKPDVIPGLSSVFEKQSPQFEIPDSIGNELDDILKGDFEKEQPSGPENGEQAEDFSEDEEKDNNTERKKDDQDNGGETQ